MNSANRRLPVSDVFRNWAARQRTESDFSIPLSQFAVTATKALSLQEHYTMQNAPEQFLV